MDKEHKIESRSELDECSHGVHGPWCREWEKMVRDKDEALARARDAEDKWAKRLARVNELENECASLDAKLIVSRVARDEADRALADLRAEVSAAFGLPPTEGPAPGEMARVLHELRAIAEGKLSTSDVPHETPGRTAYVVDLEREVARMRKTLEAIAKGFDDARDAKVVVGYYQGLAEATLSQEGQR